MTITTKEVHSNVPSDLRCPNLAGRKLILELPTFMKWEKLSYVYYVHSACLCDFFSTD